MRKHLVRLIRNTLQDAEWMCH
uniref:Uncharacterized protein n=1 Tax=Anguilla anguilla TaxID=7936 RepID=A0A0E9V851_ANGAN